MIFNIKAFISDFWHYVKSKNHTLALGVIFSDPQVFWKSLFSIELSLEYGIRPSCTCNFSSINQCLHKEKKEIVSLLGWRTVLQMYILNTKTQRKHISIKSELKLNCSHEDTFIEFVRFKDSQRFPNLDKDTAASPQRCPQSRHSWDKTENSKIGQNLCCSFSKHHHTLYKHYYFFRGSLCSYFYLYVVFNVFAEVELSPILNG